MSPQELCVIKKYQREFQERFNKKLLINLEEMKLVDRVVSHKLTLVNPRDRFIKEFREIARKHKTTIPEVVVKRNTKRIDKYDKNYYALSEICHTIIKNDYPVTTCADILTIERSSIYFYAKRYAKTRSSILSKSVDQQGA